MRPLDQKALESGIIDFWAKNKIYEKAKALRKGKKPFAFIDGPPYATGSIHMGTAWNKILKDVYLRFWRMKGLDVWDQPGYDTHGLPIENKVEQKLGLRSKKDIERFGVANFTKKCREFATKYIDVMNKQFANLGVWMAWDKPYLTLDNSYIEGAWYTFAQAHKKGLLYKSTFPVHVCTRCETVLAYNEIEYTKLTDPSIYVQFKVKGRENEYLVIWTTTPWTLPGNTAIMAHPDFEYARVKVGNVVLIIAKDLAEATLKQTMATEWKIIETIKGKRLEGLEYEHPLRDLIPALQKLKGAHKVVLAPRFVTLEQGTGLVHVAPGHGFEDYLVGKEKKLPSVSPLDIRGTFTAEAGDWLAGKYAKAADAEIIERLRERGAILHADKVAHDYPQCWRCDTPLLQLSIPEWFFKVEQMRDRLISENKKVNWTPPFAGERFKNWLQSLGDWPVSRQRYWGIPLPIWEDDKGHIEVVGSFEELKKKAALKTEVDFHKPRIDEVKIKCKKCHGEMSRVPEVLDVWFDSGAATWASLDYPRNKKLFQKLWPSEFQAEGPDQIRGWWNSQMIMSMFTFGRAPFKNILYHGFVLDLHGVKMSKSRPETLVTPEQVIEKYGRDVFRFYLLSFDPWEDFAWNWEDVTDIFKVYTVWWNTFQFVQTYVEDVNAKKPKTLLPEDKWILSRLNSLLVLANEYMEKYHTHKFVQAAREFILQDFSRTYIKLIRDRVAVGYAQADRKAAEWTLVEVLRRLNAAMAPVTPFITEEIYQQLFKKTEKAPSVHTLDFPQADKKAINATHEQHMARALEIVEAINAMRAEAKVRARWPLKTAVVVKLDEVVKEFGPTIAKLTNVKEVSTDKKKVGKGWAQKKAAGTDVYLDTSRDEKLIEEAMIRELIRKVQTMRKAAGKKVTERIALTLKAAAADERVLAAWKKEIEKGTTSKLTLGELVGKNKDKLEFEGRVVEISF